MNLALSNLLILAVAAAPQSQLRHHPDAVEVFNCQFDRQWDVNYDNWPDKWQRGFGPSLPPYVKAGIEPVEGSISGQCLVVHANGGGARLESPCASVTRNFSYKVEARLRVTGLKYARVQVRLEFCDEQKQVLETVCGDWLTSNDDWADSHLGPVYPSHPGIRLARAVLYVEPGARVDLTGEVALASLWMGRLPKMEVRTNSAFNVYANKDEIEVTCDLSGVLDSDPDILFELLDASSQRIEGNRVRVEGRLITVKRSKASEIVESDADSRAAYAGATSWHPPIVEPGFYKVCVTMQTAEGRLKRDVINIALAPPLERTARSEFGWSLAGDDLPISFDDLARLLPRVAVNWVKLPVWYSQQHAQRGDELALLAERLAAADVEVVGVLDRPPADSEFAARLNPASAFADILSADPATWMPLLDPVLTRLSLRVRWWQLGGDFDESLAAAPNLEAAIGELRGKLFRFGQEVCLGIGWSWNKATASDLPATWEFQQYSASPGLRGEEVGDYLDLPARPGVKRWTLVEPLPRSDYDLATRVRDLVEQMVEAKIHGADAIFASRPFDDERGLMTDSGAPSELLLPWRTTAWVLGGATYLGTLPLAGGSANRLFESAQGDMVMVIWNDKPTREALYVGDQARVLDVWGRQRSLQTNDAAQLIDVDSLPRFVVGLNPSIARWRQSAAFAETHIPSVFGHAHPNHLRILNPFSQGVSGSVEVHAPSGWQISPAKIDFKLAAGESASLPLSVSLPFDASGGPTPVRADFTIDADRQYRLSVFRNLVVGDGDIQIETNSRLEEDGSLVVEQRMVNYGAAPADFKCLLYAPGGRRRQRTQVVQLGASPDLKIYRYANGAELLGAELWLRAQEVDGPRVLNHRFIVEQ
ncbi:MAG: hypothetical protein IT424_04395 [Pirellulales bacterium]|nr:hypothetical protein [Pirellulales bacterium]